MLKTRGLDTTSISKGGKQGAKSRAEEPPARLHQLDAEVKLSSTTQFYTDEIIRRAYGHHEKGERER